MEASTENRREGRWRALTEDLAFHVERFLAKGAHTKIAALWGILALLAFVGGALAWWLPADRFDHPGQALWWAALRLSDPGYLAEDNVPGLRVLSLVLTILGLALFIGVLVAILTQAFTERMERLALGLSPVRFNGHLAVLGWTNRTRELVATLLEGRRAPPRVVVLTSRITAEIDQQLRERLPRRLRSRVLLRTGTPERVEDLARIRGERAEAIVLPGADHPDRQARAGDPRVLKVLASLDRTVGRGDRRPRVIAEIKDRRLVAVAHAAHDGPLQMVASDVLVGRSLALGVLSPGLSLALADLVDPRSGRTLRVERHPSLAGESLARASARFPTAILLAVLRGEGADERVDGTPDVRLDEHDRLLLLAPVEGTLEAVDTLPAESDVSPASRIETEASSARRLLILGWSGKVRELCRELSESLGEHLQIDLVSRVDSDNRESVLPRQLNHATLRHIVADSVSPDLFSTVDPTAYDCVVLVGSEGARDRFEADSRTIAASLQLLKHLERREPRPHLVAEILDLDNHSVLEKRGIELVVTPHLLSRVLAGAVWHPELSGVFERLVLGHFGRLAVLPLGSYFAAGKTTFGAIEWALRQKGIPCLGLQREARGFTPELAPDKRRRLRIETGDRALVVQPRRA